MLTVSVRFITVNTTEGAGNDKTYLEQQLTACSSRLLADDTNPNTEHLSMRPHPLGLMIFFIKNKIISKIAPIYHT